MDGHQRGEHLLDTVFSVDRTSRSIDVPDRSQVCRGWTQGSGGPLGVVGIPLALWHGSQAGVTCQIDGSSV